MRVASRDLRTNTAGVLRRAAGGEVLDITVNGEPVATLGPLRDDHPSWTPKAAILARLIDGQADPELASALDRLSGDMGELGPLR